ncbi:paraquat-inducible protein A [Hydrogenimonas sp.]
MSTPPSLRETACKECGIIVHLPLHLSGSQYRCPRCNALIYRRGQKFSHIIVMAFTSLMLFVPLTFLPILDLNIMGLEAQSTLFQALWMVYRDGYYGIAFIAMMTGVLIPPIMMLLLLAMLVPLHFGYRPKKVRLWYRLYEKMYDWGMAEVYLISIVVSMVKLHGMGSLHIGLGFYMFIFFFITFYITTVWFNPDDIWYDDDALDH